jgi:hypothetical protein
VRIYKPGSGPAAAAAAALRQLRRGDGPVAHVTEQMESMLGGRRPAVNFLNTFTSDDDEDDGGGGGVGGGSASFARTGDGGVGPLLAIGSASVGDAVANGGANGGANSGGSVGGDGDGDGGDMVVFANDSALLAAYDSFDDEHCGGDNDDDDDALASPFATAGGGSASSSLSPQFLAALSVASALRDTTAVTTDDGGGDEFVLDASMSSSPLMSSSSSMSSSPSMPKPVCVDDFAAILGRSDDDAGESKEKSNARKKGVKKKAKLKYKRRSSISEEGVDAANADGIGSTAIVMDAVVTVEATSAEGVDMQFPGADEVTTELASTLADATVDAFGGDDDNFGDSGAGDADDSGAGDADDPWADFDRASDCSGGGDGGSGATSPTVGDAVAAATATAAVDDEFGFGGDDGTDPFAALSVTADGGDAFAAAASPIATAAAVATPGGDADAFAGFDFGDVAVDGNGDPFGDLVTPTVASTTTTSTTTTSTTTTTTTKAATAAATTAAMTKTPASVVLITETTTMVSGLRNKDATPAVAAVAAVAEAAPLTKNQKKRARAKAKKKAAAEAAAAAAAAGATTDLAAACVVDTPERGGAASLAGVDSSNGSSLVGALSPGTSAALCWDSPERGTSSGGGDARVSSDAVSGDNAGVDVASNGNGVGSAVDGENGNSGGRGGDGSVVGVEAGWWSRDKDVRYDTKFSMSAAAVAGDAVKAAATTTARGWEPATDEDPVSCLDDDDAVVVDDGGWF